MGHFQAYSSGTFRHCFQTLLTILILIVPGRNYGQPNAQTANSKPVDGPIDAKAIKLFHTAEAWHQRGDDKDAVDTYRKAFKQDNGKCIACLSRAYGLATASGQYKDAEEIARDWLPLATTDADKGSVHYAIGACEEQEGILRKEEKYFQESRDEFTSALSLNPTLTVALYNLGVSTSYLHHDDEARDYFQKFLAQDTRSMMLHSRAQRFIERVDLARAKMAPPFSLMTMDGKQVSLDSLAGKVVLIDFWATWCGPCREALPHMRDLAHKFEGQPFVMISISLDTDEKKWREFVPKNNMTWMQGHEVWSSSNVAKLFAVNAIPATFSIDADGVLEDQHVGDANIDGKLKKMIAHASELAETKSPSTQGSHSGNLTQ